MHKQSLMFSAGMHVAFFVLAMVSWPWLKRDFEIPAPISIELVEISKITQTNKVAPVAKPPEEKPEPKEAAPKPPPAARNTADEAAVPVKTEKPEEEKKEPDKKEVVEDANKLPDKKVEKKPEKKQEEKKAEPKPQRDFSSVLKNLDVEKKPPAPAADQPDLKLNEEAVAAEGAQAPLGSRLTISEEDALRKQLEGCWNVPFGAKDAENLVVEIFMVINPDRTLRTARIVDQGRYNSDTFFRAAADSAMRAVNSPLCSPFQLPPDKYEMWKQTTVTFNPRDMF